MRIRFGEQDAEKTIKRQIPNKAGKQQRSSHTVEKKSMRIEWKSNVSEPMSNIVQDVQNQIEAHNPKGMLWLKNRATDTEKCYSQCKPKNPLDQNHTRFKNQNKKKICTLLEQF